MGDRLAMSLLTEWPFNEGTFIYLTSHNPRGWYFVKKNGQRQFVCHEWAVPSIELLVIELMWKLSQQNTEQDSINES